MPRTFLLFCLMLLPLPLSAQVAPEAAVMAAVEASRAALAAGDRDGAWRLSLEAQRLSNLGVYDPGVEAATSLATARFYAGDRNWPEVERFAVWIVAALGQEVYATSSVALEAQTLLGTALAKQGRWQEAEVILNAAVTAAERRPDLRENLQRARFYQARTEFAVGAFAAFTTAEDYFRDFSELGVIPSDDQAYLRFLMLDKRLAINGSDEDLLRDFEAFIAQIKTDPAVTEFDRSYYIRSYGIVLTDLGHSDQALVAHLKRVEFLRGLGRYDEDFFTAIRELVVLQHNVGNVEQARVTAEAAVAEALARPEPSYPAIASLYGVLAEVALRSDDRFHEQLYLREAYTYLRKYSRVTDPAVVALQQRIEESGAGDYVGFAFVGELTDRNAGQDTAADPTGALALGEFLSGGYLALGQRLDAIEASSEPTPTQYMNMALSDALTGDFAGAQENLLEAQVTAGTVPGDRLVPGAILLDLIDAISRGWSTQHSADDFQTVALFERLAQREPEMTPTERALYLPLKSAWHFSRGERAAGTDAVRDWTVRARPDTPPTAWDVFAANVGVEYCFSLLTPVEAEQEYQALKRLLAQFPDYSVARDYADVVRLISGPGYLETDEGLSDLLAIAARLAQELPAEHLIHVVIVWAYSNALAARGDYAGALEMLQRTTNLYRANPFHRNDELAFFLTSQSVQQLNMGQSSLGVSLARQAYESLTLETARPDFVLNILNNYAFALRQWGEPQQALKLYEDFSRTPDFARFDTADQVTFLTEFGLTLAQAGRPQDAIRTLDQAETLLAGEPESDKVTAYVTYNRAIAEYWLGDLAAAFASVTKSNDHYQASRQALLDFSQSGQVVQSQADTVRAAAEAQIGWDLAKTLSE